MSNDNVIHLIQPGIFDDQLTEVLRNGARALLAKAVEAEVADFLGKHADLKTEDGHQRVVRHGHLPEREVMTGIGPVVVRQPRVRDREAAAADPDRIRFSPSILPPYMRRSKSIETLLPILYLKGISTGDFSEALAALLGKDAAGLSASAIGRLKDGWLDEHTAWQKRDLSAKRYVYIWADGIHLEARLEDEKQCILVLIGATPEGRKELVGFADGARESAHDWRDLLLDLKRRGFDVPPQLVIADGALGFWKAAGEVWPKTREQRCWVHKTANVLAKLPKSPPRAISKDGTLQPQLILIPTTTGRCFEIVISRRSVMKMLRTTALATALLAVSIPSIATTAQARPFGYGGWGHGGWGHRGGGWGGAAFGLATGAIVGAALAAPYYAGGYGYPYGYGGYGYGGYGYGGDDGYGGDYGYGYAPVSYDYDYDYAPAYSYGYGVPYYGYRGYPRYGYRAGYRSYGISRVGYGGYRAGYVRAGYGRAVGYGGYRGGYARAHFRR